MQALRCHCGDLVLGVVCPRCQISQTADDALRDLLHAVKQCSVLLGVGECQFPFSGGTDHVHDGFRLCQCHFAGKERPLGEFSGFSRLSTGSVDCFQQLAGDKNAAVAGKFHGVLAGIAMRGTEHGGDAVVQFAAGGIQKVAIGTGIAGHLGERFSAGTPEALLCNGDCGITGNTDHGNAAGSVWGCDCCNGMHNRFSFHNSDLLVKIYVIKICPHSLYHLRVALESYSTGETRTLFFFCFFFSFQ